MKFNCGPTWSERYDAKHEWHDHFALIPRRVASGDCRWLETIERRGEYLRCPYGYYWEYQYRPKKTE